MNDGTAFLSWGTVYWIAVGACGAIVATLIVRIAKSFSARPKVFWCSERQIISFPKTKNVKSQSVFRNLLLVDNLGRAQAGKIEIFMASKPDLIEIQRSQLGNAYFFLDTNDNSWTTENTDSGIRIVIPSVIQRSRLYVQLSSSSKVPEINSVHFDNSPAEKINTKTVITRPSEALRFVIGHYSMPMVLSLFIFMSIFNGIIEIVKAVRKQ
jgi:hypothetical protein